MLFTALSVGSAGAFLLGAAALICWALSLLCVLLWRLSCRVEQTVGAGRRRAAARAAIICACACPARADRAAFTEGRSAQRQAERFLAFRRLFGLTESDNNLPVPHVGVFPVGVSQITFSDCFGLFAFRRSMRGAPKTSRFCPIPCRPLPLPVSPGEGEKLVDSARARPTTAFRRISAPGRMATS